MLNLRPWRFVLPIALPFVILASSGASSGTSGTPGAPTDEGSLDAPGTYFLEVGSGRDVRVGRSALVAWSPNTTSLAHVRLGEPNELVLEPRGGGESRLLGQSSRDLQVGTAGPWDAGDDWSPDGAWIAVEVTGEQFKDCAE